MIGVLNGTAAGPVLLMLAHGGHVGNWASCVCCSLQPAGGNNKTKQGKHIYYTGDTSKVWRTGRKGD